MFIVPVGSLLTSIIVVQELASGAGRPLFNCQVAFWLWFTVLLANFAEAMAEGRDKAQADTLRKTKTEAVAMRLTADGQLETMSAATLRRGDLIMVRAGEFIPADGESIEGVALVAYRPLGPEAAAAQHADVRPGRGRPAVCRHQGHRHAAGRHRARVMEQCRAVNG